jgi:hypothetical protein
VGHRRIRGGRRAGGAFPARSPHHGATRDSNESRRLDTLLADRLDVGIRWTIAGLRALLLAKLQHKYHHDRWSPTTTTPAPTVRINLMPTAA